MALSLLLCGFFFVDALLDSVSYGSRADVEQKEQQQQQQSFGDKSCKIRHTMAFCLSYSLILLFALD